MREIKFRGKSLKNGEFVYGFYHNETSLESAASDRKVTRHHIYTQDFDLFVDPETVGQYIGKKDRNENEIYEGDIMQLCSATYPCLAYWDGISWAWLMNGKRREIDLTCEKMEIIGNIYDNKELLDRSK